MPALTDEAVIWHDVECGGYATDLPLWRDLAGDAGGPVLEIGCGTGRVALDLARRGHVVTAVDNDPALVAELRERARARALDLTVHVRDARLLELDDRFALIAVPMQMIQLFDRPADRQATLAAAARCLAPRGTVAVSIVEGVPAGGGDLARSLPDVAEIDGWIYSSQPLEIVNQGASMLVTRLRQIVAPEGNLDETVDETRLSVLDAGTLVDEAREVGLRAAGRRDVPTTEAHVGSTVALLEAG